MRAPFQDGEFPAPVKYGYLNVGVVEQGPPALLGRTVFCLYPHQDRYVVPAGAVSPVPAGVPAARAVLAGAVETAVNALWDAAPRVGDRIAVVGAGMVGCCVARLLAGFPAARVQLVDTEPARAAVAAALGVGVPRPGGRRRRLRPGAARQRDRGRAGPVAGAARRRGRGGRAQLVRRPAGARCRSARRSTPAGWRSAPARSARSSPARRARRGHADRIALALGLLADPAFDALMTGGSQFEELPAVMPRLASGELPALCHRVAYPDDNGG